MTATQSPPNGVLVVDKPSGPSSHGVVAAARKALGTRKIGHAGTLDPMATGVLVLGVGHATRLLTFIVGADKEYLATIRLGERTTTDDAEGEPVDRAEPEALAAIDDDRIESCVAPLRGEIDQVPSAVSAIKVDGKRAYQRVRDGEQVELAARRVTVSAFEVLDRRVDAQGAIELDVRVECSSGTYIRALARDLGDALGVGAHLTALRRTRVGSFTVAEATRLSTLATTGRLNPTATTTGATEPGGEAAEPGAQAPEPGAAAAEPNAEVAGPSVAELDPVSRLIAPADAARRILPALELTEREATDLGHGKRVRREPAEICVQQSPAAAFAPDGRLIGVVAWDSNAYRPLMNLPEVAE